MSYPIIEKLISKNRSYQKLIPSGFVIHSTDTLNATDENEQSYFDHNSVSASVHYFVDYDSITRTVPENEVAWGCGSTGNRKFLQVELCEFDDTTKFNETYLRTVWLVADACVRYHWNVDSVFSHADISRIYKETDHSDPIAYLAKHGKTFDQMKTDIAVTINAMKSPVTPIVDPNLAINKQLQINLNRLFNANLTTDGIIGPMSNASITNAKSILGTSDLNNAFSHIYTKPTVKIGCSDILITRYIQYKVGASIDGQWGPNTDKLVKSWQLKNKLVGDGIIGNASWAKMIG